MGLSIDEYWNLTPREFNIHLKAYKKKNTKDFNDIISIGWNVARFDRAKKLKNLNDYLIKDEKKKVDKEFGKTGLSFEDMKRIAEKKGIKNHPWKG